MIQEAWRNDFEKKHVAGNVRALLRFRSGGGHGESALQVSKKITNVKESKPKGYGKVP